MLTIHGAEDYTAGLLLWAFPLRFFRNTESLTTQNLTVVGWAHYLYHRLLSIPVYRLAFKNVDRFVVFSTYMQNMLRKEGIASVCIPNATELYTPKPIPEESKTLLYVGRLEKIKGVQYVIEALPDVVKHHPNARLVIAGKGTYEHELRALVDVLSMGEYVTFAGHCTRAELYEHYTQAACVVVPSVWPEPFGKVGIEALSVGRPVIASNVGGISEWLNDGETGYLVPPEDTHAITERVTTLLGDRTLLLRMSKNAVHEAQRFSIEEHAEKITELYQTVLDESR